LSFAIAACQQAATNSANELAAVNTVNSASAPETTAPAPAGPTAEENAQRETNDAAGNATGPVALASDPELPQTCQAHIRAVQACTARVRSRRFGDNLERMLCSSLHSSRTETWPAWARADFLERGCVGQTEGLGAVYDGC